MLQALRREGAASLDPVRFRFMEALADRAASRQGESRRLLEGRLAAALQDYRSRLDKQGLKAAEDLSRAITDHPDAADDLSRCHQEGDFRRLRQLVFRLDAGKGARLLAALVDPVRDVPPRASAGPSLDAEANLHGPAHELRSVACFREAWLNLSVNQQLGLALAQAPDNAGPLNSHILALQSLELMRDVSPGYLQHFMSYVDGLLWLELAEGVNKTVPKAAPVRGERDKGRKPGRGKRD